MEVMVAEWVSSLDNLDQLSAAGNTIQSTVTSGELFDSIKNFINIWYLVQYSGDERTKYK